MESVMSGSLLFCLLVLLGAADSAKPTCRTCKDFVKSFHKVS